MTRKILLSSLLVLLSCHMAEAGGRKQKFFNLTAEEVKIDSILPYFSYSMPLEGAWNDSVYSVSIEYAEFIGMSDADVAKYRKIRDIQPPALPRLRSDVVVERKRGHLEVSFMPIVMRDGRYEKLVSFMLDVKSEPANHQARRANADSETSVSDRYAPHSVLASGRWAKIRVPSTGIYQITDALIRRAGFSDLNRVKVYGYGGALQNEVLKAKDLIEYDDLKEVVTCNVDGKRLFYARGPVSWSSNTTALRTRNPYSDYGYYFLTESDEEPLMTDSTSFVDSFYPSADDYHTLHEIDNYAWYQGGRNLFENTPVNAGDSKTYILENSSWQPGLRNVYAKVTAGQNTTLQIKINGSEAKTVSLSFGEYDHGKDTDMSYKQAYESLSDTVTITTLSGGPVRLDYISVTQDVPRPRPTLLGSSFEVPEYVYNITNQDLHADGPADMVIIVPASAKLTAQAQRLKDFHEQHDGLRVRIVPADELFNEFSSGTPDANAYRRYLKMLYDRAETEADMPSYLLLFGDCVWDNRMNTAECGSLNPDDFLLCYESENSFSAVTSYVNDGFFCLLDDGEGGDQLKTDKLDMAVGRFPVRNEVEAKAMVDKTISYVKNENAGNWQNVMVFLGDDGDQNEHMTDADLMATLIETLNPAMYVKRIMWDVYTRVVSSTGNTYPEVTKLIKQQNDDGALIINYNGHGRADQMSHERVLTISDVEAFTNKNLPFWITATCDIMPFDSQQSTFGESAVLNEKGGAIAFFGTARTVYTIQNEKINRAYLKALFTPVGGKYVSIGEAQRLAKNSLITPAVADKDNDFDNSENRLQYSLLGDPAIVLNIPRNAVVIDSINGIELATAAELPLLKAGSVVSVKGHVETASAVKDAAFNGVLTATVRDAKKKIVCKLNNTSKDDGASTPFIFYDRDKVLYNGNNDIRDGEFGFSFAVTKDISYSDQSGMINIFAVNSETNETVNGYNEDFIVGGTGSLDNDMIGPSIYCYLNSPTFTNGDNVNPSPYFVATVSDKDGINAAGSGIGHDLVLTIDGKMEYTYVLNDNFKYDFGSYTSGTTYYNLPELEPGKHTLKFKAWDIMNNSSTAELTFNVVRGLRPDYLNVGCTSNPARENTTFIISHDRAGSDIDLEIDVLDVSGRPLWSHKESGVSPAGTCTVDWDLTGSNGSRLHTGVYLYRVRMSSDGSAIVSKTQKLIIIGR